MHRTGRTSVFARRNNSHVTIIRDVFCSERQQKATKIFNVVVFICIHVRPLCACVCGMCMVVHVCVHEVSEYRSGGGEGWGGGGVV